MEKYVYYLKTGNYLHNYKGYFKTRELAIKKMKEIVDMRKAWVHQKYVLKSCLLWKFDTEAFPEYRKIFKENTSLSPPESPTKSELGLRLPKKKPQP